MLVVFQMMNVLPFTRIYPDKTLWNSILPKLVHKKVYSTNKHVIWKCYLFCRSPEDETSITCSNHDCPYAKFHMSCLSLRDTCLPPKTWYYAHSSRLPECRKREGQKQLPIMTNCRLLRFVLQFISVPALLAYQTDY